MKDNIINISKPIIKSDIDSKELSSDEFKYTLKMDRSEFDDDKDMVKFVNSCKRMIRSSPEYKVWVDYLRNILDQYTCAITKEINSETSVEIHHHPYSLYDIVYCITSSFLAAGKDFNAFTVSTLVVDLHYQNRIGYVPLITSMHEKFHNGCLEIPMELVMGDWNIFHEKYGSLLDEDDIKKIKGRLCVKFETCSWSESYNWQKCSYAVGT